MTMLNDVVLTEEITQEWWLVLTLIRAISRPTFWSENIYPDQATFEYVAAANPEEAEAYQKTRTPHPNSITAVVALQWTEESTQIRIMTPPQHEPFWKDVLYRVVRSAGQARRYRRITTGNILDRALSTFYRKQEAGEKITLKEIAEEFGVSYDYLRQYKYRYERVRKEEMRDNKKI